MGDAWIVIKLLYKRAASLLINLVLNCWVGGFFIRRRDLARGCRRWNGHNPHANQSRRFNRPAAVGRAYGTERHPARFRPAFTPVSRAHTARSCTGFPGRAWRHGNVAEQHRDRPDGGRLCRWRAGRSGTGPGGHARGQCRHHPDRATAVFRHRPRRAAVRADRRHPISPQLCQPDARPRPRGDRARTDAPCPAAAPRSVGALRRRAEPASVYGCDRDATGHRCDHRRCGDVGRPFERRDGAPYHVVSGSRCGPAARCLRLGARGQSRHRYQPAARRCGRQRSFGKTGAGRQSVEPTRRRRSRISAAQLDRALVSHARTRWGAARRRFPHRIQSGHGGAISAAAAPVRPAAGVAAAGARGAGRSVKADLPRRRCAREPSYRFGRSIARGAAHG